MTEGPETQSIVDELWTLTPGPLPPRLRATGTAIALPSAFAVEAAAVAAVAASTAAIGSMTGTAGDGTVTIDRDHALAACTTHVRLDGRPIPSWAPLSGRYLTADDRFVMIHANFAHHAAGVAAHLGVAEDRDAVAAAIATWRAEDLETALVDAGLIAAMYRTEDEWAAHPHAIATAELPLLTVDRIGDGPPRPPVGRPDRALAGLRVADCSRVLAGPVCGQTLAAHGADVMRVGAPHLPSVEIGVVSTGFGKRNTHLDLRLDHDRTVFGQLLEGADVLVDAYRPGALAGHGFAATEVATRSPGIVMVEISAFDWLGPWAGRRGFDSIVQTTTGLAMTGATRSGSDEPVHLPIQALDYATGYLAAHAAARLVAHQRRSGGSWRVRLSLLRTRNWLAGLAAPADFTPAPLPDVTPWTHTVASPFGSVEAVRPVAGRWDLGPAPLGTSAAQWLNRPENPGGPHP